MVSVGKTGGSSQSSYVWDKQQPYLEKLYSQASGMFDESYGPFTGQVKGYANAYEPYLKSHAINLGDNRFLKGITSGTNLGMGGYSDILSGESPGMTTMAGMMSPEGNPYLEGTISDMYGGIARNLEENILPMQRSEESVLGQYGGSRGDIAEGMAKAEAIRTGGEMERSMRSGAYETDMQRALQSALGYTGAISDAAGGYTGTGMTAEQLIAQKAGMAPEAVASVMNLGLSPYTMPYDYLSRYKEAIGGPVVLGQGSSGSGFSFGLG